MYSSNGSTPAPRTNGGAFPSSLAEQPRTRFLPDLPVNGWMAALYHLHRQRLLTFSFIRWVYLGFFAALIIWVLARFPGGWWVLGLWLFAVLALTVAVQIATRRRFVTFMPADLPETEGERLEPADKIPVYVTGKLGVENRTRAFSMVPGFYRTFASREHALLCLVRSQQFLALGAWPEEEEGLWYAFIGPTQLRQVSGGRLSFGRTMLPALFVEYLAESTTSKGKRRITEERVWLAFAKEADRQAVLADLRADAESVVME